MKQSFRHQYFNWLITMEMSSGGISIVPKAPTIMHHQAIHMPAILPTDRLMTFLALKLDSKASKEPIPPNHTIENTKPRDKSWLTLTCNSRLGGICSFERPPSSGL
jgi:hypothetical protein